VEYDRKNDSCWGSNGSSRRNRLTPNRPSFVCAINRLVLTTSAAPRQGEEFVRRPGRARPPESIGSHKHPRYNQPPPHRKLISIPPATRAIYVNAVLFCMSRQSLRWQYACAFTTSTRRAEVKLHYGCFATRFALSSPPPLPSPLLRYRFFYENFCHFRQINSLTAKNFNYKLTKIWYLVNLCYFIYCLRNSRYKKIIHVFIKLAIMKTFYAKFITLSVTDLVNQRNFNGKIVLKKEKSIFCYKKLIFKFYLRKNSCKFFYFCIILA